MNDPKQLGSNTDTAKNGKVNNIRNLLNKNPGNRKTTEEKRQEQVKNVRDLLGNVRKNKTNNNSSDHAKTEPEQDKSTNNDTKAESETVNEEGRNEKGGAEIYKNIQEFIESNETNRHALETLAMAYGLLRANEIVGHPNDEESIIGYLGYQKNDLIKYLQIILGAVNPSLNNRGSILAITNNKNPEDKFSKTLIHTVFELDATKPNVGAETKSKLKHLTDIVKKSQLNNQSDNTDVQRLLLGAEINGQIQLGILATENKGLEPYEQIAIAKKMGRNLKFRNRLSKRDLSEDLKNLEQFVQENLNSEDEKKDSKSNIRTKEDAFQFLKIDPNTPESEIRKLWKNLVKKYHPDQDHFDKDLYQLREKKLKLINIAFNIILN